MPSQILNGPAGQLEAWFEPGESGTGAVLCHPHPLYGGTMDDMVLQSVNTALMAAGISTLRFNFRGVGQSEGTHDKGNGEVQDVAAAARWLLDEAGCDELIIAGYSFGAGMALTSAKTIPCQRLILVAPPVAMFSDLELPGVPALVVLGEADQIVSHDETRQWFSNGNGVATIESIAGADHFFFGAHDQITAATQSFVTGQR